MKRWITVLLVLTVGLVLAAAGSLLAGAGGNSESELLPLFIELRAMRLAAATLVGAGLAMAGVLMQGLFRNPLAEPGIIGTSAGASLGGMVTLIGSELLGSHLVLSPVVLLPLGCVGGGLLSLWLVLVVTRHSRDNLAVLLCGVVMAMLFTSLGGALSAWAQTQWEMARALMTFSMGSIDAKGPEHILLATPLVLGAGAVAWGWGRQLDVLLSGEDEAASLGIDHTRARRWLIVWATLLVAGAVAVGGGIAFVGLVVPHALRGFVGPTHRRLLPVAALGGALFVLLCDVVVRLLPTRGEIPLGVITGLVGAPVFLWLMVRRQREARLG
jgi:iron complex transport system permease protein